MVEVDDVVTHGWEAIEAAAGAVYPNQEPKHFGTVIKYSMGGADPLDGCSIYHSSGTAGGEHWHYVTFGFSELYGKESDSSEWSGFGFELTFRLRKAGDYAEEPPTWPISLMQNLARYVFTSGNYFDAGHYLDCNSPILLEADTDLTGILFVPDPELGTIETPNGKVNFLQIAACTGDELKAAVQWETLKFADLMAERVPMLVTDLERKSIMLDATIQEKVKDAIARDGSKTGVLFVTQLDYDFSEKPGGQAELVIGAQAVADLKSILPARTKHGRELALYNDENAVRIIPSQRYSFQDVEDGLELHLTDDDVNVFVSKVQPKEGEYQINQLRVRVLKTPIKDHHGEIVEVVG